MNFKNTKKPKSQEEQIDKMWDFLFHYLAHKVAFMDTKIMFILSFMVLVLALLGVLILRLP